MVYHYIIVRFILFSRRVLNIKRIFNFLNLSPTAIKKKKKDVEILNLNKNADYSTVQCIASEIGTTHTGKSYNALNDEKKDFNERCNLVKYLIEDAAKSKHINKSSDCLKIFMLPEFFFRGPKGGYSLETSLEITNNLRKMVSSPEYKDWLFVFGTTVAYSNILKQSDKSLYEVYNYSFIQMGNGKEEDSLIVMKEHKSPMDFITAHYSSSNEVLTNTNTSHIKKTLRKINCRNEQKQVNYDGNSIFKVGGLTVGLDICLDNARKRLNMSTSKKSLDLHLVTSGGLLGPYHISKLKNKGVLFHCDGTSNKIGYSSLVSLNDPRSYSYYNALNPLCTRFCTESPATKLPVEAFTGNRKVVLNIYPSYKLPYKNVKKCMKRAVTKEKMDTL